MLSPVSMHSRHLFMAPMFHAAGSNNILPTIWSGQTAIIQPSFEPNGALDLIEHHEVTSTLGVPTMIAALVEAQVARPRNVSSMTLVAHGGSPIASDIVRRAADVFETADFCHVYGATELSPLATGILGEQKLLDSERKRSCGQPLFGTDIRIRDRQHRDVPVGEVGEVAVRGPNVMAGYWNKPEQTAEVLRDDWYYCGDLGFMDDEAYVFLVDRAKDMIITGGESVYGIEVEEVLYLHPAVLEAAVFGIPDEKWGEAVHAVVVPREPVAAEDLIEFCKQHIASYKAPKSISLQTEELPKSGPGKVLKRILRERFDA